MHTFSIDPFRESALEWLHHPEGRTTPASPKVAATVMLVRGDPLEVFMIERARTMAFAPSIWVFPGGGVDAADASVELGQGEPQQASFARFVERSGLDADAARGLLVAAVRELFEEAGVLLAGDDNSGESSFIDTSAQEWLQLRHAVEHHERSFADVVASLTLRTDRIEWVDRWITPEFERRRFDAWFFVAALPQGAKAEAVSRESQDGRWVRPQEMVDAAQRGEVKLLPPTLTALRRLARAANADVALAQAQAAPVPAATRPLPYDDENGAYLAAEVNL